MTDLSAYDCDIILQSKSLPRSLRDKLFKIERIGMGTVESHILPAFLARSNLLQTINHAMVTVRSISACPAPIVGSFRFPIKRTSQCGHLGFASTAGLGLALCHRPARSSSSMTEEIWRRMHENKVFRVQGAHLIRCSFIEKHFTNQNIRQVNVVRVGPRTCLLMVEGCPSEECHWQVRPVSSNKTFAKSLMHRHYKLCTT